MTPDQIKLVQDSFQKVAPIAGAAADIFYDRLFHIAPELRPLFPTDLSNQKVKLMQMLGTAVSGLSNLDQILPAVQNLGRRHHDYQVTAEHYTYVGSALLFTLEEGLGEEWNGELKEAWTEAYNTLAKVMIEA